MSSQIVPVAEKFQTVQAMLVRNKAALEEVLPKVITYERMMKVVNLCIRKNPKILDCTEHSIMGAVMEAASLGLEPGILGQCFLVPFKNNKTGRSEVQLIAGYKGLIHLCRNTGELASISAEIVYFMDKFEFRMGTDPFISHIPTEEPIPDPVWKQIRGAYAVAKLKDGSVQFALMFRRDLEKIRKRSKSAEQGPWVTDPEEMCKKTAIRRLAKLLPASTEKLQRLVELDEQAEAGIVQDIGAMFVPPATDPAALPAKPKAVLDRIVEEKTKNGKAQEALPPPDDEGMPSPEQTDSLPF